MASLRQAFVLGAGLGTRLRPLTDELPKPLVPVFQKPLITFALDHLIDLGVEKFFVNTHHRPERFTEVFTNAGYRGRRIEFFHEPVLLETAGGIANIAASLVREPLLVYNGDVLTDLPIAPLMERHVSAGNMVTLALRSNAEPKHVAFDSSSGRIVDIRNQLGSGARDEFLFTGIYIVDPMFVDLLERGVKRSVIPHFLDLIRRGKKIGGIVIDEGNWWDVGSRDAYLQLHRELSGDGGPAAAVSKFPAYPVGDPEWKAAIHKTAAVDLSARLRGCTVVGKECRVGADALLEDTILWPGAQIASRSCLSGCIVRTRKTAEGTHRNVDI
jgi:mannose-1-phosphate guanylyltransferase